METKETVSTIITPKGSIEYKSLGKQIKVSPRSLAAIHKESYSIQVLEPTVEVIIGIGKDSTAHLVMTERAWEALKSGEEVKTTTAKEFRKTIL